MGQIKNYTFGQWLRDWLNVYKKPYVKSINNHKIIIRLHIPDSLKNTKLEELNALDVQKALNNVKASRTRVDVYDIYHGSLKMAFKLDLIKKDLAELLIKPKHEKKVGSALSERELQEFLTAISSTRLENFYLFCVYSGCRRGEALNLLWSDIDFENKVIHIRGTKTKLSDRRIPLFDTLEDILRNVKRIDAKVFHHRDEYVTKSFKKYCPNHKLHDLRHTFATRCLECGINIKVVQRWLGHSRLDTTASIYTHVTEEFFFSESKKFRLT